MCEPRRSGLAGQFDKLTLDLVDRERRHGGEVDMIMGQTRVSAMTDQCGFVSAHDMVYALQHDATCRPCHYDIGVLRLLWAFHTSSLFARFRDHKNAGGVGMNPTNENTV